MKTFVYNHLIRHSQCETCHGVLSNKEMSPLEDQLEDTIVNDPEIIKHRHQRAVDGYFRARGII
jgi:hypothetical protein